MAAKAQVPDCLLGVSRNCRGAQDKQFLDFRIAVRYSPVPAEDINMKLSYTIKFVADMDRAVKFYRDTLGLPLKFESPGWSEFATGETTLALHPASEKNPAGAVELGFTVPNLVDFHTEKNKQGLVFSMPPKKQDFGGLLAQFVDSEGGHCSVGEQ